MFYTQHLKFFSSWSIIWKIGLVLTTLLLLGACSSSNSSLENTTRIQDKPETQTQEVAVQQKSKTIVAFGDSLTAGFQLAPNDAYPAQLEQHLEQQGFAHYKVINSGLSGETTAGGLRRVDWVLQSKPDIVILTLGGNDLLRALKPSDTRANLENIIKQLQDNNIDIILGGLKAPQNLGKQFVTSFEEIYPSLAKKYNIPLIPFFLENVALNPSLNLPDGKHPNKEGYRLVVENIWPLLKPLLETPE